MSSLFSADDADARPRAKAGRARQMEIARETTVQIDAIVGELLDALQRPALPAERILAETIAATTVRARRLRENGRDDAAERRELSRQLRSSPFAVKARQLPTG